MPNWSSEHLVVSGPERELDAFVEAVDGLSRWDQENQAIGDRVPEGAAPARAVEDTELTYERLLPPPPHFAESKLLDWRIAHWGTKWAPDGLEVVRWDPDTITYTFNSAWSGPERFVEHAAGLFPALGFALHSYEPGNIVYQTRLFEGGVEVARQDFSDAANREKWLFEMFGFTEAEVYGDDIEADLGDEEIDLHPQAQSVDGVDPEDLDVLTASPAADPVDALLDRWTERDISEHVQVSLLAGHLEHWDPATAKRVVGDERAIERMLHRPSLEAAPTEALLAWAIDQLDRGPMPRPDLVGDEWRERDDMIGEMVAQILEQVKPDEATKSYTADRYRLGLARRTLEALAEAGELTTQRNEVDRLVARHALLDPQEDALADHRNAIAAALLSVPDLPGPIIESVAGPVPDERSEFMSRVVEHPNTPAPMRAAWLRAGPAVHAVLNGLELAATQDSPEVRAAILAAPDQHPTVFLELAQHAEPEEFAACLDRLEDEPYYIVAALEQAGSRQKAAVRDEVWAELLSAADRDVRERALLAMPANRRKGR